MAKKIKKDGTLIYSKEEKIARLLKYLKEHTDKYHPASIPLIKYYFDKQGCKNFFGNKNTRKNLIKDLVMSLNTDFDGNLLPEEDWIIVYRDFVRDNGITSPEGKSHHICEIYYNHPFDSFELNDILSSIDKNDDLSDDTKSKLKTKINKKLKSSCYDTRPISPTLRLAEEKGYKRKEIMSLEWYQKQKWYHASHDIFWPEGSTDDYDDFDDYDF